MPGYYIHLAACNEKASMDRSFIIGVETPDLLKQYVKLFGIKGAKEKYDLLKTDLMPDFSRFETRLKQKESHFSTDGMHYGLSDKPDVMCYWNSLTEDEKHNPFYLGYLWHLLTDLLMYAMLNKTHKLDVFIKDHYGNSDDFDKKRLKALAILHSDWDKTNLKVLETYQTELTREVSELKKVKFEGGECYFVEWNIIKETTNILRAYDPFSKNIDWIIKSIIYMSSTAPVPLCLPKK